MASLPMVPSGALRVQWFYKVYHRKLCPPVVAQRALPLRLLIVFPPLLKHGVSPFYFLGTLKVNAP